MIAVLGAGGDAMVTGRAAAYLRGMVRHEPAVIDVVSSSSKRITRRPGVRIRRGRVRPDDVAVVDGIPTASVARSLVDMADRARATEVAAAMHEADFLDLLDVRAVRRCNDRRRTRRGPGYRRAAAAIDLHCSGSAGTQSALERKVLDRFVDLGVPMPEITPLIRTRTRRIRPDLLFRAAGLAVEVNGKPHERRRTQNDDRIKAEELSDEGIRTRYVHARTWRSDVDLIAREEFGIG